MKRIAIVVAVLLTLTLFSSFALAIGKVLYEDQELGFSFELPEGMEYQGDLLEDTKELMQDINTEKIDNAMSELGQSYEKQPFYLGYSSTLNVLYIESSKLFDDIERVLPNGVSRDEIDLCLLEEKDQEEVLTGLIDALNIDGMPKRIFYQRTLRNMAVNTLRPLRQRDMIQN